MNSVMLSQLPSGGVISGRAVDRPRETVQMSEVFAQDLYVMGEVSLGLSFAISAARNYCFPSKFPITAPMLDCYGG
jgi:hypothetical protein